MENRATPASASGYTAGRRLLTIGDLRTLFRCGRTTAYSRVHEDGFPASVVFSGAAHRWWEHEVLEWVEDHRRERPPASPSRPVIQPSALPSAPRPQPRTRHPSPRGRVVTGAGDSGVDREVDNAWRTPHDLVLLTAPTASDGYFRLRWNLPGGGRRQTSAGRWPLTCRTATEPAR